MNFLNNIKKKVRYNVVVEWYNLLYLLFRREERIIPTISSIDETIKKIVEERSSVSRFGDGEILLIEGKAIGFQSGNSALGKELKEVLESSLPNHLISLSDTFQHLGRYTRSARRFWRCHFYLYGYIWE
ncbi:MAG: GT-D fold domain-containing glycosyltransferase, partial [Bacteroidales bacterium]